ncbi:MAG: tyrosine-protein phosphatase [Anaerolineae bacterium]|nr:tyrosine-protein phosphatase [Anaerolineae bacterium]
MKNRILDWQGCKNVRDLGGLRTRAGGLTRFGQIVRADTPSRLTVAGWAALYDYGIRTIVSLRTHGMTEPELDVSAPYPDIAIVQVEIEDVTNRDFVQKWASTDFWSTPLYYPDALQLWPERHAAAVAAIGQAAPGGVLFHCVREHDRTGIISLLLLALAGAAPDDILADYALSLDPERETLLASRQTSTREVVLGTLEQLDAESYLLSGGASREELSAVRARLLG